MHPTEVAKLRAEGINFAVQRSPDRGPTGGRSLRTLRTSEPVSPAARAGLLETPRRCP